MSTITYSDFFAIMKKAFEATQEKIADFLGYDASYISRVKRGTVSFTKKIEDKLSEVFDPKKSNITLIQNNTEAECFDILKTVIRRDFGNVYQGMQDYWGEKNYYKFAKKLITRAHCGTKLYLKDDPTISDTILKEAFDPNIILAEAFDSYDIAGYLRSDLQDALSPSYVFALYLFLDTVKDCVANTTLDEEENRQEKIKELIKRLQYFLAFLLGGHTGLEKRCQDFKVPDFENTAFWDEAERMRKELLPLFEDVYKRAMENSINFLDDYNGIILSEHPGKLE